MIVERCSPIWERTGKIAVLYDFLDSAAVLRVCRKYDIPVAKLAHREIRVHRASFESLMWRLAGQTEPDSGR
jgi:hypothetical protein